MKRSVKICVFYVFTAIVVLIVSLYANSTFSYEYKKDEYVLFYDDDRVQLRDNIRTYLSDIDDYLIPNSSFLYSDVLIENYDFLTNFALDYIINNRELYFNKIKKLDNYSYHNAYYEMNTADEYISLDDMYKITDKYFGISYYSVINDNVNIISNYISLSDYVPFLFKANILDISISLEDDFVVANVIYDSKDNYKYTFKKVHNVLKIYNIEVLS